MPSAHERSDASALVLTIDLEPDVMRALDTLRRAYFPPERNQVPAHVTLFHALPGAHVDAVGALLRRVCPAEGKPAVRITAVRSIGRGTALTLDAPDLLRIHARLVEAWRPWLTRQDAQRFAPHVVIENKVGAATAARTLTEVERTFRPRATVGEALHLWRYAGGPWESLDRIPFGR